MRYDFQKIESKWQKHWEEQKVYKTENTTDKPKYYVLDMFPYPSGAGLHVGHVEGYTATDIVARYKRMNGFNVMHPMGWDAFGLPAEQYAVKTGKHPKFTTEENIANFKRQIKSLGLSYDWDREVNTTDEKYYRWTQWIFLQLYKKGLAYVAEVPVNWCPELGTVLANEEVPEQVANGLRVERRPMRQWMLKITEYAEQLLQDLDDLDWPESLKDMQRNWIGKSRGAEIDFAIKGHSDAKIRVYTTRPDTIFGATFMVLAPEHPLVDEIASKEEQANVAGYKEKATLKSELERTELSKKKTGTFTGAYAINPANGAEIPIWIADYVMVSYGTGAIMCVPHGDERDEEFAKVYNLPIVAITQDDVYINSENKKSNFSLNGLTIKEGIPAAIEWLEKNNLGEAKTNYKLRDWLFSRQRYWGEPFPIVYNADGNPCDITEDELPVILPEMSDFKPTGTPEAPLTKAKEWLEYEKDGKKYIRETNTMPQWAGSCWYYLRFLDPDNDKAFCDLDKEKYWMPVDLYIGGAEHAVLHLIYARFWHKVLHDLGYVSTKEPFQKLFNQGMILGYTYRYYKNKDGVSIPSGNVSWQVEDSGQKAYNKETGEQLEVYLVHSSEAIWKDGKVYHQKTEEELEVKTEKMSKSIGNVVTPDEIIARYGADSLRLYEMFMGPLEQEKPWNDNGIEGTFRFLRKIWNVVVEQEGGLNSIIKKDIEVPLEVKKNLHKTIEKVTNDLEKLRFNTAISQMMIFVNDLASQKEIAKEVLDVFITLLSPLAPHIAEELWETLGNQGFVCQQSWPQFDPKLVVDDEITLVVQVNGKLRASIQVAKGLSKEQLEKIAKEDSKVQSYLDKEIRRTIVVPDKLVNFVL